jgi:hypothetical protein
VAVGLYVHRPSKTGRIAVRLSPEYGWGAVTVYTGTSITALQRVGRALEHGYGARVAFDAVTGQEYRIVVASRCDGCSSSPFDLRVGPAPLPANDDFSAARTIRIPGEYKGNTADATAELGEAERHRHSVWYRIKPRRTGDLTIDLEARTCGGGSMTVYTGNGLQSLRRVRSGDPIRLPAVLRLSRAARRALAEVEHLNASVRLEILGTDAPNRVLTVPVRL